MLKTLLKVTAVAALTYVAFQVGRQWDETVEEVEAGLAAETPADITESVVEAVADNIDPTPEV